MTRQLYQIDRGEGEAVVLFHGAASHSGQWRALIDQLTPTARVIAFDQYGYRDSPSWPEPRPMLMADQIAPILDYLQGVSGPIHLVGHSHGASLAALTAVEIRGRVASLSMYEPNSFGALTHDGLESSRREIIERFGDLKARMETDESRWRFAEDLMNFWLGQGAWHHLRDEAKAQIISVIEPTAREVYAALYSPFEITALEELEDRVLVMFDPHTPPAARLVSERYQARLSKCRAEHFPRCGHLAPITHASAVNNVIMRHLQRWRST